MKEGNCEGMNWIKWLDREELERDELNIEGWKREE